MFSLADKEQIKKKGLDLARVEVQLDSFRQGFPFLDILAAAGIANGILSFSDTEEKELIDLFEKNRDEFRIMKFVPASGAASRMFKSLLELLAGEEPGKEQEEIFNNIERFAFIDDLKEVLKKAGTDLDSLLAASDIVSLARYILKDEGLAYENLPKGLIKFHSYAGSRRTAMEEHLVDGASLVRDKDGIVNIHFTISPEHEKLFLLKFNELLAAYEDKLNVKYNISYSFQKPSTDTIAVDMNNKPFYLDDGSLFFRPAGHGALLDNLNELEADIVYVSNIDNVAPDKTKDLIIKKKKLLAGVLLKYDRQISDYLKKLDEGADMSEELVRELKDFIRHELNIRDDKLDDLSGSLFADYCHIKLNRPLRVCGMVKNEGEPGGGPFFARNADGSISLQIVESSQIDVSNEKYRAIVNEATHFNPVDLVCKLSNYRGEKFNLPGFRDMNTGFISTKSKEGRDLKAMELPGLWNGAMSDWNTIFVEVPVETFNPVKTLNDLLRPQHQ